MATGPQDHGAAQARDSGVSDGTEEIDRLTMDVEYILEADYVDDPSLSSPGQITEHLYIGNRKEALDIKNLGSLGITHVLNCAASVREGGSPPYAKRGIEYHEIDAFDDPAYDLANDYAECLEFWRQCSAVGGKLLVHCHQGINRSGGVATVILMHSHSPPLRLLGAIDHIRACRRNFLSNRTFRRQLAAYALREGLVEPGWPDAPGSSPTAPYYSILTGVPRSSPGAQSLTPPSTTPDPPVPRLGALNISALPPNEHSTSGDKYFDELPAVFKSHAKEVNGSTPMQNQGVAGVQGESVEHEEIIGGSTSTHAPMGTSPTPGEGTAGTAPVYSQQLSSVDRQGQSVGVRLMRMAIEQGLSRGAFRITITNNTKTQQVWNKMTEAVGKGSFHTEHIEMFTTKGESIRSVMLVHVASMSDCQRIRKVCSDLLALKIGFDGLFTPDIFARLKLTEANPWNLPGATASVYDPEWDESRGQEWLDAAKSKYKPPNPRAARIGLTSSSRQPKPGRAPPPRPAAPSPTPSRSTRPPQRPSGRGNGVGGDARGRGSVGVSRPQAGGFARPSGGVERAQRRTPGLTRNKV